MLQVVFATLVGLISTIAVCAAAIGIVLAILWAGYWIFSLISGVISIKVGDALKMVWNILLWSVLIGWLFYCCHDLGKHIIARVL